MSKEKVEVLKMINRSEFPPYQYGSTVRDVRFKLAIYADRVVAHLSGKADLDGKRLATYEEEFVYRGVASIAHAIRTNLERQSKKIQ